MLADNLRKYRKAQNMSQEDLAVRMHVVRQTVSKWENSLSVPDADQLISLAEILKVSVNDLLGTAVQNPTDRESIAEQLAKANEQISGYAEAQRIGRETGKIRGLVLWLTIFTIAAMHIIRNEALSIALSTILLTAIFIILYRNISLLSADVRSTGNMGSIKAVTIFDIAVIIATGLFGILIKTGRIHLTGHQEALSAAAIVAAVMILAGIIAPKLPYNRYTGLRLPWTVQNEGAWHAAHKVLGVISMPLALLYMSLVFFVGNMEILTFVVVIIWIGVPGIISLFYTYN